MKLKTDLNKTLNNYMNNLKKLMNNYKGNLPAHISLLINRLIIEDIHKNFNFYGRYNGSGTGIFDGGSHKWKELSPLTIRTYKYEGWKGKWLRPTLFRSGELYRSINVNYRNNLTFEISANRPYARIHQLGGRRIPARPYIVIQKSTKEKIEDIIIKGFNQYISTHQKELFS